jgi:hypothetical protein
MNLTESTYIFYWSVRFEASTVKKCAKNFSGGQPCQCWIKSHRFRHHWPWWLRPKRFLKRLVFNSALIQLIVRDFTTLINPAEDMFQLPALVNAIIETAIPKKNFVCFLTSWSALIFSRRTLLGWGRLKLLCKFRLWCKSSEVLGPRRSPNNIVTCYLVTCQIICRLRILYLDLLVIHQATFTINHYSLNLTVITLEIFTGWPSLLFTSLITSHWLVVN